MRAQRIAVNLLALVGAFAIAWYGIHLLSKLGEEEHVVKQVASPDGARTGTLTLRVFTAGPWVSIPIYEVGVRNADKSTDVFYSASAETSNDVSFAWDGNDRLVITRNISPLLIVKIGWMPPKEQ